MLPLKPLVYNNINLVSYDKSPRNIWVEGLYTPPDNAQYETIDGVTGVFLPYSNIPLQGMKIGLSRQETRDFIIDEGTGLVRLRPPAG